MIVSITSMLKKQGLLIPCLAPRSCLSEIRKHLDIEGSAIYRHRTCSKYPTFNILKIEFLISARYKPLGISRTTPFAADNSLDHFRNKPSNIHSGKVSSLSFGKLFNTCNNVIQIIPKCFNNRYCSGNVTNDYFKNHTYLR